MITLFVVLFVLFDPCGASPFVSYVSEPLFCYYSNLEKLNLFRHVGNSVKVTYCLRNLTIYVIVERSESLKLLITSSYDDDHNQVSER